MNWNAIAKSLTKDEILKLVGLTTRESAASRTFGALGLVSLGVIAGAAVGLLLAPRPGAELRRELSSRLGLLEDDQEINGQALDELIT